MGSRLALFLVGTIVPCGRLWQVFVDNDGILVQGFVPLNEGANLQITQSISLHTLQFNSALK